MEWKVEPLQLEELDEFVRVLWDAMEPLEVDEVLPMIYTSGLTEQVHERLRKRTIGMCKDDIPAWCYVAKDAATGQIVGISQWDVVRDPARSQAELDAKWDEANKHRMAGPRIEGLNSVLGEAFMRAVIYCEHEDTEGKPFVTLRLLSTRPGFGNRGVGSALLKYGLAKFDGLGLQTYLDASVQGLNLYKKFGFEVLRPLPFDGREYGGRSEAKNWCMLRPVQSAKVSEG